MMIETQRPFIVAIDGGAGTGTSSLAETLSRKTGWPYLNTGQLYRGVAHLVLVHNIDVSNHEAIVKIAEEIDFRFDGGQVSHINDQYVLGELYKGDVNQYSSIVAAMPGVRTALRPHQHAFAAGTSCIVEGRDIGGHLFPEADLKLFLTCSDSERARRRSKADGRTVTIEEVQERDKRDSERDIHPMKPASDAIIIDTTYVTSKQVVAQAMELVTERVDIIKPAE